MCLLFGTAKRTPVKKAHNHDSREQIEILRRGGLTAAEVEETGERTLVLIYDGKAGEKLDQLRAWKFSEKMATGAICVQAVFRLQHQMLHNIILVGFIITPKSGWAQAIS